MISRFFISLILLLSQVGCISSDEKIVDLSGAVFIIFLVLVAIKYITPKITKLGLFIKFSDFLKKHIKYFTFSLYGICILLILFGFGFSGIHKIHVFSGFVVGIIAYNVKQLSKVSEPNTSKFQLEIISLGISFLFVFFLLWWFGSEMFAGL